MTELEAIVANVGFIQKLLPVAEAVGVNIGPLVRTELADGEALWANVLKAAADLKAAYDKIHAVATATVA